MFQHTAHLLLDAARITTEIAAAKERNKQHICLYRGHSEEALDGVAPYLFRFGYNTSFSNWYLKKGWGDAWGVLLKSSWPPTELHKHFRKFLLVKTEEGKELYFRFYDPRVLRTFLPTCDAAQIREFFGSAIDYFLVEDEDPDYALRLSHQNGILHTQRISVKNEIAALPEPEPLPPPAEDPLPPETIAYLKEHGITLPGMEQQSAAPAENAAPAAEVPAKPVPAPQKATPAPVAATPSAPATASPAAPSSPAASPKPKTKWNTFE